MQKTQDQVKMEYISIFPGIFKLHRNVNIDIDILYVNKIPFMVSQAKSILFATLKHIVDQAN
eukprot:11830521-Ditylum_brightwellii.AAC.1